MSESDFQKVVTQMRLVHLSMAHAIAHVSGAELADGHQYADAADVTLDDGRTMRIVCRLEVTPR